MAEAALYTLRLSSSTFLHISNRVLVLQKDEPQVRVRACVRVCARELERADVRSLASGSRLVRVARLPLGTFYSLRSKSDTSW